jgi:hypothetical protein
MPDANRNYALNAIVGAAFGGELPIRLSRILFTDTRANARSWFPSTAAGQRCMALSVRKSGYHSPSMHTIAKDLHAFPTFFPPL